MPIAIVGVKLFSLLHMELGFMLIHLHGVKIYAHCYTWCET